MPEFTLLTLNAHMGFGMMRRRLVLPALRDAIRGASADVVCLQEVMGANAKHAARHPDWPEASQYEYLAEGTWPQHAYGRNAVYPEGHHGNALLTRFAITRFDNRDVSIPGHEPRGMLHAVLDVPGATREVHVVCTHLGLREVHRQAQLRMLCALVSREIPEDAALIVAGDFNDWRLKGHNRLRECGLIEVFEHAHGSLARTFPARMPTLRVDRIYTRNVQARDVRVLHSRPWSHLSDHAPLMATVEL